MSHPALLGFGSGLDTTEALVSQIPDAIGYLFDVLLDRRQHVGEHRGATRSGDRDEIGETSDAETEIGLRTFAPLLLEHLAAVTADVVIGCKRLCVDTGYWETYNRPNVMLIDVGDKPIEMFTPAGIRAKGQEYAVDAIVFATGFDALTGALLRIDIRGKGGQMLKEKWREGPKTYLARHRRFPKSLH